MWVSRVGNWYRVEDIEDDEYEKIEYRGKNFGD